MNKRMVMNQWWGGKGLFCRFFACVQKFAAAWQSRLSFTLCSPMHLSVHLCSTMARNICGCQIITVEAKTVGSATPTCYDTPQLATHLHLSLSPPPRLRATTTASMTGVLSLRREWRVTSKGIGRTLRYPSE